MTIDELKRMIAELKLAAASLAEPERTFKLQEVGRLEMKIESMALDDVAAKMAAISLPDQRQIDEQIAAAKQALKDHASRLAAIDTALGIVKTALGILI